MFAISRKTSTACSVTSGPIPSPGRTTIFNCIPFGVLRLVAAFNYQSTKESGDKSPPLQITRPRSAPTDHLHLPGPVPAKQPHRPLSERLDPDRRFASCDRPDQ